MSSFIASLVREKTSLVDETGKSEPLMVRSNRIYLKLEAGAITEKVVIRTQTMHTALSLAGKIMFSYYKNGFFFPRLDEYEWERQWRSVLSTYERKYNPDIWGVVYINGKAIFQTQENPFMDVLEKCALVESENYDASLDLARQALDQLGQSNKAIDHVSGAAAMFSDDGNEMKAGIIHRDEKQRKIAINFTVSGGTTEGRVVQALNISSAYLEGLNLKYHIRKEQENIDIKKTFQETEQSVRLRTAMSRLTGLDRAIKGFEKEYDVEYHPKKPSLFDMP